MNNELLNIILTEKPDLIFKIFSYLDDYNIQYIRQNATKYAINRIDYPITQNNIDILIKLNLKLQEHSLFQKEFNQIYLEKQNEHFISPEILNVDQDLDINLYPGILLCIHDTIRIQHTINNRHHLSVLPNKMNTLKKNTSFIHYIFKNKDLILTVPDTVSLLKSNFVYFQYSNQLRWKKDQIELFNQVDFLITNDPHLNINLKHYYKALINDQPLRLYYLNQIKKHVDIKNIIIDLNLYRLSKLRSLETVLDSDIIDHIKKLHLIGCTLGGDIKSFIIDGIRNYKKDIKISDLQLDNLIDFILPINK